MSETTRKTEAAGGHEPSRRGFLKQSGAAVAGATLASTLGARAYAQSDETLKVVLVGCGGRGTGAANQALRTSGPIQLVAMADVFKDRLEDSHRNLSRAMRNNPERIDVPEERRYVGFDAFKKAMEHVPEGKGYVILATPPGWRPQHFEHAVNQNRHVFMEKPLSTDAPGVRRILASAKKAREKNLKVGVGLQRHHQRSYQETIQRIHDGAIGDIATLRVYWNGGGVWTRQRQPDMNEMQYQMLNWYYFNWLCGDHITEQHIHNLDVGNWVKNDFPIAAQGMGGREVRTEKEHGQIFDHHAVEYIYRDGSRMISQCRHIRGCYKSVSEWAHGTKGSAAINGGVLYNDQRHTLDTQTWKFEGDNPNPYQVEHDALVDAIRNNKEHMEAEYGAKSTFTSILGRMATYSGKMLRWDTMLKDGKKLAPGQDSYTWDSTPPVQPGPDGFYPVPVPGEYDPTAPVGDGDKKA